MGWHPDQVRRTDLWDYEICARQWAEMRGGADKGLSPRDVGEMRARMEEVKRTMRVKS